MKNRYFCTRCGKEMTALTMSDDHNLCQNCFRDELESINTDDESIDTRYLPDETMNRIIEHGWR